MHIGLRLFIALLIVVFGVLQAGVVAGVSPIMRPIVILVTLGLLFFFWHKTKPDVGS